MYAKKKEEENQPFDYSRISKPSQFSSLSCIYIFRAPSSCFWSERIFFRYLGPLHSRHGAGRDERKEKYEKLFSAEMQTKARMEKRFRAFFPVSCFRSIAVDMENAFAFLFCDGKFTFVSPSGGRNRSAPAADNNVDGGSAWIRRHWAPFPSNDGGRRRKKTISKFRA